MNKDYIYGKMNSEAIPVLYKGVSTNTAEVIVDNTNRTIKVAIIGEVEGANLIESISVNGEQQTIVEKNVDLKIPVNTSELLNDSEFIDANTDTLVNYYKKDESYSQTEIDEKINYLSQEIGEITSEGIRFEVISHGNSLPVEGDLSTIYLLELDGKYDQWVFVSGEWLEITADANIDLSDYVTREELEDVTKEYIKSAPNEVQLVTDLSILYEEVSQLPMDVEPGTRLVSKRDFILPYYVFEFKLETGSWESVDEVNTKTLYILSNDTNKLFRYIEEVGFVNILDHDIPEIPTSISAFENDAHYATEDYVNEFGGKIDTITVNGETQEIVDKTVNIVIPEQKTIDFETIGEGNAITSIEQTDGKVTFKAEQTFLTEHQSLDEYAKKNETVNNVALSIDDSTYVVTLQLKDVNGNALGEAQTIDLPLESIVVKGEYTSDKKVKLTLHNNTTVEFSVADLVSGLQNEITSTNKLNADLVDDTNSTNKFVTAEEKTIISNINLNAEENVQSDWSIEDNTNDAYILNKPTKLSQFENDLNIDLSNYYTKDEVYTKTDVYTKDETYSKAEIEALIQASIETNVEATVNEIMEGSY